MDEGEYRRRRIEIEASLVEAFVSQNSAHERVKEARRAGRVQLWGLAIAVVTVLSTIAFSTHQVVQGQRQVKASSEQFERTLKQTQYSDIVSGLASSSVGVQVNSLRLLVQYVQTDENFESPDEQSRAAVNAAQVLTTFIQDESLSQQRGLSYYQDAQPIVISRAFDQIKDLVGQEDFSSVSLDLSNGDFHGVDAADLKPQGVFQALGADFRRARITGWDLRSANSPDLGSAFLTCADLRTSKLGSANLAGTDLTGTDLRGADLSETINLTEEQLRGARIGTETKLPEGVEPPPQPGWGVEMADTGGATTACRDLVDAMTHLPGGSGYSSRYPCEGSEAPSLARLSPEQREALLTVCEWRSDPSSISGVPPPDVTVSRR